MRLLKYEKWIYFSLFNSFIISCYDKLVGIWAILFIIAVILIIILRFLLENNRK